MPQLAKAYRVLAESKLSDTHLIVTSDRARALSYLETLANSPNFTDARIELGTTTFTMKTKEQLP